MGVLIRSHWTPRYVVNRIAQALHEKRNPDLPWITKDAVDLLESFLKATDVGFEFGSGRSTVWFARRISRLTSVEDNCDWADRMARRLAADRVQNVVYLRIESPGFESYIAPITAFDDRSLDFVMIDGAYRGRCSTASLPKLAPGGVLAIDNAERYLPSASAAPAARSWKDGPIEEEGWPEVWDVIRHWRYVWTSNGVADTAIFLKPCLC